MQEHHVYFAVFGFDEPPQAVSLLAGISPDDSWCVGDYYGGLSPPARRLDSRWILSSNLDRDASHRDHFERLCLKLERLGERLPLLRQQYRCGIGVSQYFFMDEPAFYLPATLLERFGRLNLPLSFDQFGLDAPG